MLKITNLSVDIENKNILNNVDLDVKKGEMHALMGPNGSGKSTLTYALLGHPSCIVKNGSIAFEGQDITDLSVEKRANLGIFLALQYPLEIPGLDIFSFLKEIYCVTHKKSIANSDFYAHLKPLLELLQFDESYLERGLNEGFSGGEKKRLEILQLLVLEPKLAILDEIDSGLDIDSLKIVCNAINNYKKINPNFTVIIVTHYQRILNYIEPDHVHIFNKGGIIKSGDFNLAKEIELNGYKEYV